MSWNSERTLKLIESFHALPCLWDTQIKEYKNRNKKTDAYTTLAAEFNVTATEIEKKLHALKVQFRREHKKCNEAKKSGSSPKKVGWFGYEPLLFLLKGNESRGSRSTVDSDGDTTDKVSTYFNILLLIILHSILHYIIN